MMTAAATFNTHTHAHTRNTDSDSPTGQGRAQQGRAAGRDIADFTFCRKWLVGAAGRAPNKNHGQGYI